MTQSLSADERHHEVQLLLPWYVTERLDPGERSLVVEHLERCEACRAELASERMLASVIAGQPAGVAPAWDALVARLDARRTDPAPPRRRTRDAFAGMRRAASRPQTLGWVVAAQFAALLVLGTSLVTQPEPAPYRVLGAEAPPRAGNVLAMFRPQTTEAHLRRALQASGARLVDGPTAAHAYLLEVPGGEGGAALSRLRGDPEVTMAEPIDQAAPE